MMKSTHLSKVVVVGLGYVGLPVAVNAAQAGYQVSGLDLNEATVTGLMRGRSHVDDIADHEVAKMVELGFSATTNPDVLSSADVVVICVPTPLSLEGGPDLSAVEASCAVIVEHLKRGALIVLESTTWPGTTAEVVRPILERSRLRAGQDFYLAFSPERIDPGNEKFGFGNTPKVVGGYTSRCSRVAEQFYASLVTEVVVAKGAAEAEMTKLLENTYRHINIALVNEMAKFSHELGIDFWDVIRCAKTKPFGFQSFTPGPGVGGHCIPIDPNYLSHRVRAQLGYPFRFVELAQEINQSMPKYVVERMIEILNDHGKPVRGSRVLLLGVTYKSGIADQRESPALTIGERLLSMGAQVAYIDPYVPSWQLGEETIESATDLASAVEQSDVVIHLQPHPDYDNHAMAGCTTPILDTRGVLSGLHISRL